MSNLYGYGPSGPGGYDEFFFQAEDGIRAYEVTGVQTCALPILGVWTGYNSPYLWPAGNVQGQPAGTPKIWAQVATEGASAYPTQSRVMSKATAVPGCSRFGQTRATVPFQANTNPDGTANPLAG